MLKEMQKIQKPIKRMSLGSLILKGFLGFSILCVVIIIGFLAFAFYSLQKNENMEWLNTRLEATLNKKFNDDFELKIGKARFASDNASLASLYLEDFQIIGKKGTFKAVLSNIYLVPDWVALLDRRFDVRLIKFDGAELVVNQKQSDFLKNLNNTEKSISDINLALQGPYLEGGHFPSLLQTAFLDRGNASIANDDIEMTPQILHLLDGVYGQFTQFFKTLSKHKVSSIEASNINLKLVDESQSKERFLFIKEAQLVAQNDDDQTYDIALSTIQDNQIGFSLELKYFLDRDRNKTNIEFNVKHLLAENFVTRLKKPDYPIKIDVPMSAVGKAVLNKDHLVEDLSFTLLAGEGGITTGPKSHFLISRGSLNVSLNRKARRFIIKPSSFLFTKNRFQIEGSIKLPPSLMDPYYFELAAYDSYLSSPDVQSPSYIIDKITAEGAFQPAHKLATVSKFHVQADELDFEAAASFGFDGKTPSMALAGALSDKRGAFNVNKAKQIWPIFIAPSARSWTLKNVKKGSVKSFEVTTSIPTGVLGRLRKGAIMYDDEMQLGFDLQDAAFKTYGAFPVVEKARVLGKARGISFFASSNRGEVRSRFDNVVSLEKAHFEIPDFRFPAPEIDLSFLAKGAAKDVGEIADRHPINALQHAEIKPDGLNGRAEMDVSISMPLKDEIQAEDIKWQVNLSLDDFGNSEKIDGRDIQNADVKVKVIPGLMSVKGRADIDGITAGIDLLRPFDNKDKKGSLAINVVLGDEERKKLGLGLDDYLKGPVSISIDQNKNQSDYEKGDFYKVDLTNAELRLDFLGWRKAKGIPAQLVMELKSNTKGTFIRNLDLRGKGFRARGELDLTSKGDIKRLKLNRFSLKDGDNIQLAADLKPENTYRISISGKAFDARSFIRVLTAKATGESAKDPYRYQIDLSLDRITGYLGETINAVELETVLRGGTPLKLKVSGFTEGAARPFTLSYGALSGKGDVLLAEGGNGGALARFSNIYYRAYGGAFRLLGQRLPGAKAMTGNFRMTNFRLLEEPALKGLSASKDNQGRSSVRFDVLDVDFEEKNQRLNLTRGLLTGENVGGTYQGVLNRKTKAISFTGTYVPAYVLNNFITKIPILGLALGNGQREGLIGVTFKVEGTLGKPQVSVNPLSALAPGFLRQLFKFRKSVNKTN